MKRILIIEDDRDIVELVRYNLASEGFEVTSAADGSSGLAQIRKTPPDLLLLDLMLPKLPGLEVCKEIRRWSNAALVVLSARQSDQDKAILLDAGADDYVTKPFSPLEFTARVRANLRRVAVGEQAIGDQPIPIGELLIDLVARTIRRGDQPIHLTPIEWELMRTLVTQAGRTLTHRQLFHAVWGRSFGDPQQYLRVHVANLRRKIEQDAVRPQVILTEPGVGYRLEIPG